ncbi:MAG TPA: ABC transporter ATP-binding protein [Candidatus Faecaligallichristensenella faecipullorum]|nr:ABC transporter ATP-binding protein [Candidatus Faecaligallichristensenella faecipullorum]
MDIVKRLYGMLKPYWRKILVALALQTLVIITRLVAPYLTKSVVNDVITAGVLDLLLPLTSALLALAVVRAVCTYIRSVMFERIGQNVAFDLRTGLYAHLEEMPYEFYDKHRIGEIMSRMTGDLEGVRNLIASGIITAYDNLLNFVLGIICLSSMSWQLALIMAVFCPLLAVTAFKFNKRIRPAFTDIREQNAVLNTRTQENLAGVRVVKAFARENHESEAFSVDNLKVRDLNIRATIIWSVFVPLMNLMGDLCTPVMVLAGGALMLNGRMDLGTLVGATGFIWLITNPMRMLSNIINMVAQAITSAEKLLYYVDLGASIREPQNAQSPARFEGKVEFDHVTFSYGGEVVLDDVSFVAQSGQTIAVMGATGAGKSSLVNLLGRYYDIQGGSVKVDGIDVREQKLKPLRRELGYVMQETFLFSDTIADNIRFGRPDADMDRVRRAARVAQAEEFIEHMPEKYETIVGERGLGLSGGQKQRVAIARAVLTDPKILIMDDSTSAVDMETEYEIQQQLKDVLKGRTTFIIAHRISSVKNADQILVLKDGKIAERGTHAQLLDQRGIYFGMVQDQYRDFLNISGQKAGEA